jgi:succinyl-diaminopimelate desuccinylase
MESDGKGLGIDLWDQVSQGLTNNMGTISGNEEELTVGLNYRYPVTKSFDQCAPKVKAEFEAAGFAQLESRHDHQLYVAPESELVQKLMKVYTEYSGRSDAPKSIGGGTYAKSMPNVVAFGPIFPGDEVREHKPDEFMELSRLVDNAIIYANSIYALAND